MTKTSIEAIDISRYQRIAPPDLGGRVVIVTGAGQGIGRVFAQAFAAVGAKVVVAERNREKGEAVTKEISDNGLKATFIATDVSDSASVEKMVAEVWDKHGRIDILLNNAALFSPIEMRPFTEIPLEEWNTMFQINSTGVFLCTRAVAPAMKKQNWGRIITIGAGAVTIGKTNYLHYVSSKSALIGMTRSISRELGPFNITANIILPGAIFTEIERKTMTPEQKKSVPASQCIQRPLVPDDLVGIVFFLGSDASGCIAGQSIHGDAGATHS